MSRLSEKERKEARNEQSVWHLLPVPEQMDVLDIDRLKEGRGGGLEPRSETESES